MSNLPVFIAFTQVALGNSLIDLSTNNVLGKPGILSELRARRGLKQPETVHKELERLIGFGDITLAFEITPLHVATRMPRFGGTQNAPVRERNFAMRAAANTEIVAKTPVIKVVLTLIARLRIG